MDLLLSQIIARIKAEVPLPKQWAVIAAVTTAFNKKQYFNVLEIKRSLARQIWLYAQGRTRPGSVVTDTIYGSLHLKGLAMDVKPIAPTTYDDLARTFIQFGITHPITWDKPHYQFDNIGPQPLPPPPPDQLLKEDERRLTYEKDPTTKTVLQRVILRLKQILHIS